MTARRAGVPLHHPGPRPAERIVSVPTPVTVVRAELPPGAVVADALWELTRSAGCRGASAELAHGCFGTLRYVHPAIATDGTRIASFSDTVEPTAPGFVVGGSATVGTREGRGFAHVHAAWLDGDGALRGGHLLPGTTVGDVAIQVTLRALPGAALVSETDPETTLPAFTPHRVAGEHGPARAVVSRVRPGVDLHEAVVEAARRGGFSSAVVRASLGSAVGARLRTGPGRITEADWPATEFTALTGTVEGADGDRPRVTLAGSLVDLTGRVHAGVLLAGQNPVAVTFELFVEEAGEHATR
ncbi:hypothetical protein B1813_06970 [Saccharomonospora piscinae]|uniref:PPC domain-containing protein n=1 Tax=Saccharomonospora piscinae TaxID=687388 RepID=A0A1V9A4R0_SACPI|nr:DUF296 domain-containing protein [Saccharomonospora piscinae]OQO92016.1 hypothetical protein B1813_06970 [Saccharomonospora piscinae]TLW92307.1 DNA-binding protein [Saccharomonospora piscinae]